MDWIDKVDNIDDIRAEDINQIAHEVIDQGIEITALGASASDHGNRIDGLETAVDTLENQVDDLSDRSDTTELTAIRNSLYPKQPDLPWDHTKQLSGYNYLDMLSNATGRVKTGLKGRTLKNELDYNRDTWAEWTKTAGVVGDSTGLEFTANGTSTIYATLNTNLKPSTKYGILVSSLSSQMNVGIDNYYTGSPFVLIPSGTIGNAKSVFTTSASIASNICKVFTGNTITSGYKSKIKDIRIFELPTGSQIEADFTNLTADELAVKYPYIKGGELRSVGPQRLVSCGKNLLPTNNISEWEIGALGGSGENIGSTTLIRTKGYISIKGLKNVIYNLGANYRVNQLRCYDTNKNFLETPATNPYTIPPNVAYLRVSIKKADSSTINLNEVPAFDVQLEEGSIATPYEPHTSSTAYYPAIGNRLPNGVADDDQYQRVQEYVLQVSDIGEMVTSYSETVDFARIPTSVLPAGIVLPNGVGVIVISGYTDKSNIPYSSVFSLIKGDYVYNTSYSNQTIFVAMDKGTTRAQAQTALAGTKIWYQLATPLPRNLDIIGYPITYPNGEAYTEPCLYGYLKGVTSKVITTADRPVSAIRKVVRYDVSADGKPVGVDVTADASITGNGTAITVGNADLKKWYFYDCAYDSQYTLLPEMVMDVEVEGGIVTHDFGAAAAIWTLDSNEGKADTLIVTNAGAAITAILPATEGKQYIVKNQSGQTLTAKTASSTGVTVAAGKKTVIVFTGTDYEKISEV